MPAPGPDANLSFQSGVRVSANYRLYRLDGAGKITTGEWIEAVTDEDAMRIARENCSIGRHELWQRNRLVGQIVRDD